MGIGGAILEMHQDWGRTKDARQEAEGVGIGGASEVQHRPWGCIEYARQVAECVGVGGASPEQCKVGSCLEHARQVAEGVGIGGASPEQRSKWTKEDYVQQLQRRLWRIDAGDWPGEFNRLKNSLLEVRSL